MCPYYRSACGKKYVAGEPVEEGEGLGPRKELFSLLSKQLQDPWAHDVAPCELRASAAAGASTVSVRVLADSGVDDAEGEGAAAVRRPPVRCTLQRRPPARTCCTWRRAWAGRRS